MVTKFKKGDRVEILPGTVEWKSAVYVGRVWFVWGHSSCGLHLVDFRKSSKAATERMAVMADCLRRAPKLVPPKKIARPAAKQAKQAKKPMPAAKPAPALVPEKKYPVLKQRWVERERGWGHRPGGETLHLTREDRDIYIRGYNATFNNQDEAPDEYTMEDGEPEVIDVDEATYKKLVAALTSTEVRHPWAQRGISV